MLAASPARYRIYESLLAQCYRHFYRSSLVDRYFHGIGSCWLDTSVIPDPVRTFLYEIAMTSDSLPTAQHRLLVHQSRVPPWLQSWIRRAVTNPTIPVRRALVVIRIRYIHNV